MCVAGPARIFVIFSRRILFARSISVHLSVRLQNKLIDFCLLTFNNQLLFRLNYGVLASIRHSIINLFLHSVYLSSVHPFVL